MKFKHILCVFGVTRSRFHAFDGSAHLVLFEVLLSASRVRRNDTKSCIQLLAKTLELELSKSNELGIDYL